MREMIESTPVRRVVVLLLLSAFPIVGRALHAQSAAATPPPAAANESYVYCWSKTVEPVFYTSGVFAALWKTPEDANGVKAAFLAFLQKKYGFKGASTNSVECFAEIYSPGAYRGVTSNKRYGIQTATAQRQQIVDTGWMNTSAENSATYTAAQVAANQAPINAAVASATAASAAADAAFQNYMVCSSNGSATTYFSDVFNAPKPPPGPRGRQGSELGQLFLAFLTKKYTLPPNEYAMCSGGSPSTAQGAQTLKQQLEERAKQARHQVIETGWKNTP